MKIIITEEQKKKLFIPRKIDERQNQFEKITKKSSDKFLIENNIESLKYKIFVDTLWGELDTGDISNAIIYEGEIVLNTGEKVTFDKGWRHISHSDFIEYGDTMSIYLSSLLLENNPKDLLIGDLEIEVKSVVGKIEMDFIFSLFIPNGDWDYPKDSNVEEVVQFFKTL